MQKVEVKKSEFLKLIETKTKQEVMNHYGLSKEHITDIAKQLGVTFKKRKETPFVIIDDSEIKRHPDSSYEMMIFKDKSQNSENIETPQDVKEFLNNVPGLEPTVNNIAVNAPTSEEMMSI